MAGAGDLAGELLWKGTTEKKEPDMTHAIKILSVLTLTWVSLSAAGCADPTEPPAPASAPEDVFEVVPEGKADDYRSTTGREYALLGFDTVVFDEADLALEGDARTARAEELVTLRFKALSFFLYAYLAQKSRDDKNFGYGGFRTTVRQQTFETLAIDERDDEPGTFDFLFEAEAAGPNDLFKVLPIRDDSTFSLIIPILTNAELSTGSYARLYKNFNPDNFDARKLTSIDVEISPKDSEPDAYPEYDRLFDDGLLDVAIHVGGDYNDKRYDLLTARDLFDDLQDDLGLKAPVETFDALRTDSGPFVGELRVGERTIRMEVTLIHPDMQKEEGVGFEGLLQLYRESAATRDVVLYDGHAGYNSGYSGVVVHYNPRHAIAADDFADMDLPDKYQVFMFNGCKTYTAYADALYANPKKDIGNLDILTTVNFSWLSEMTRITGDLLEGMTRTVDGDHAPMSYDALLADLNRGRSWDVIYGVHGLSDNPRLSPWATPESLCAPCEANAECTGADNLCLKMLDGERGCAAACTDASGCPEGFACRAAAITGDDVISTRQCVPTNNRCIAP